MPGKAFPYLHLRLKGDIATTQSWSTGLSFDADVAGIADPDLLTWLSTAVAPLVTTWWNASNGAGAINTSDTVLRGLEAETYVAGSTVADSSAAFSYTSPGVGGSAGAAPTQTCVVVSTRTFTPGVRGRGRMYIPATGLVLNATHNVGSLFIDALANSTATLITALNATSVAGSAIQAIVAGSDPTGHPITSLRVDSEPDIQRRRADKIRASYQKVVSI